MKDKLSIYFDLVMLTEQIICALMHDPTLDL